MLKLIALTTLVVFPILLLLLLQIQFLPFHDVNITWAQRAALFLDISFLWLLRPPILADLSADRFGRARVFTRILRGIGLGLAGVMSIAAIWFSIVVATIPGERQETALARLDPPRWQIADAEDDEEKTKLVSTRDLFFAGEVDLTTRRRKSLFSNTLVPPGFNLYEALKIDDPKKLAWKEHLFDLRARHLEQAVLYFADLTKADLTGAKLQGAFLDFAKLQGAALNQARLQGARLVAAQLQGASLQVAQLQGAFLFAAQLQGAELHRAQLQGASLDLAQLQSAFLIAANLQGASLDGAQLQGASLNAELHGASLVGIVVNAADFSDTFLWRTKWGKIDPAKLGAVRLKTVTWNPAWRPKKGDPAPWDAKAYAELRGSMNSIPEGETRDEALKRIETLDCANPDKTLASCDPAVTPPPEVLDWQKKLARASVDEAAYAKALTTELRSLVCARDANAVYILRGIRGRLAETGREAPALVDFIMSRDCSVSASLTDDDKAKLLKIKQDAEKNFPPPPVSKN